MSNLSLYEQFPYSIGYAQRSLGTNPEDEECVVFILAGKPNTYVLPPGCLGKIAAASEASLEVIMKQYPDMLKHASLKGTGVGKLYDTLRKAHGIHKSNCEKWAANQGKAGTKMRIG